MNIKDIQNQFEAVKESYETLGKNITDSLRILLQSEKIQVLSIYYRVKSTESFVEKISRKSYLNPLEEIEDICGVRIICYYQKDIERISDVIKKEFSVHESEIKENSLNYNQFGYRSQHLIACISKQWERTPNYRGLSSLKCEIQIRTVLMHAWAEIEHSLAYKSEFQAPAKFRRKLYRISAKLEEADEQFEELKIESSKYQQEAVEEVKRSKGEVELNIDTLQAFMDSNFPKRKKSIEDTGALLNQMVQYGITLRDLNTYWSKIKPHFLKLEEEYIIDGNLGFTKWMQTGIARFILDIFNEKFRERNSDKNPELVVRLKKIFDDNFA